MDAGGDLPQGALSLASAPAARGSQAALRAANYRDDPSAVVGRRVILFNVSSIPLATSDLTPGSRVDNGNSWPITRADIQAQRDRGLEFANGVHLQVEYKPSHKPSRSRMKVQ